MFHVKHLKEGVFKMYEPHYKKYVYEAIEDLSVGDITLMGLYDNRTSPKTLIIYGEDIILYLDKMYPNYKTLTPIFNAWYTYNTLHFDDFLRMYDAVRMAYNPIENYNSETITADIKQDGRITETITHGKTTTDTANGVTNENSVTTFEDTTYRPNSKSVQSGSTTSAESGTTTTEKEHTTAVEREIDGKTYTGDEINENIEKKHGNIGVQQTQQMLQSEIELRMKPVIQLYIDTFVKEYFYCNEGVS